MRCGDGLAVGHDLVAAAEAAVAEAVASLDGHRPDLVCVFVSGPDPDAIAVAGRRAMEVGGAPTTLGCSAGGVIGGGRGVELGGGADPQPGGAVAVWAGVLPGATRSSFRLTVAGDAVVGFPEGEPEDQVAVVLADPYTFPITDFVRRSNDLDPWLPLIGGMASGPGGRGSTRLFGNGEVYDSGAVGLLLGGAVEARTVVSQGCRPIGPTMVVTDAQRNLLLGLANVPAFTKLAEIVSDLPPEEQELVANGLQLGIAMDEYADEHGRGDFLIRGVLGVSDRAGAVAVAEVVEVGQTVRFQVRDAEAADAELSELLTGFRAGGEVQGALLFSCNGRGRAMFATADHDVLAVRKQLGVSGVAGFFAAGEIGPVGRRNHVHGFTASILAFR
jgi:small ligand-binding sensory domain FIST